MKINKYIVGEGLSNRERESLEEIAERDTGDAVLGFAAYLDVVGERVDKKIPNYDYHNTFGEVAGTYLVLQNMERQFRKRHDYYPKGRFLTRLNEELRIYHKKIVGKSEIDARELHSFFREYLKNLKEAIARPEEGANEGLRLCLTSNLNLMEKVLSRNYKVRFLKQKSCS